jgi:hypothetical protein
MDLDRIAIKLRSRNSWEGIDLGFAMAREWFFSLWLLWLCSALPVMLLLVLLPLPLWLAGLVLWWLKPAYEPPLLYWLSRRVFSETISVNRVFSAWKSVVLPQLFAALTWRRLSFNRSFYMPVVVLEGLRQRRRKKRIAVLGKSSSAASWLTIVGLHFEVILQFGLLGLILALIPEDLHWIDWQSYLFEPDPVSEWLHHLTALVAMSLIAPFYVAAGFALYLTRRSQLEAWDLELGFRQLVKRQGHKAGGQVNLLIALFGLLWMGFTVPGTGNALELSREDAQTTIQEVLKDEAFGKEKTFHYWEYIGDEEEAADELPAFFKWLEQLTVSIARVAEFMMWLLAAGVIAYLVYWFVQNQPMLRRPALRQASRKHPKVVAGLDIRPECLPDDPAQEAARLIKQGAVREGLALLYRATLIELIHHYDLPIHEGDTEGDCLARSRKLAKPEVNDYFCQLTDAWQRLAYAHRLPDRDQLLVLCHHWHDYFEAGHVR